MHEVNHRQTLSGIFDGTEMSGESEHCQPACCRVQRPRSSHGSASSTAWSWGALRKNIRWDARFERRAVGGEVMCTPFSGSNHQKRANTPNNQCSFFSQFSHSSFPQETVTSQWRRKVRALQGATWATVFLFTGLFTEQGTRLRAVLFQ